MHGCRTDAAIANNDRRDPLRQLRHHLWVPYNIRIVVGVHIDKAGRKDLSGSIYYVPAHILGELPDRANDAGIERYIRSLCFGATTVEHTDIPNQSVKIRHRAW